MFIKSITLHGFKSYGASTTITDFNPQFNAITGLNGCGKSNILDSICFVLGQNAPTQFRVTNMQELVYKKGAGGISFASVTIVFDNRNKRQSPINFENKDEIVVERRIVLGPQGKSKFTINGSNVTQANVIDMFKSVQLNIQNPHFLIMQGRITKVLNMKPEEIWCMVEEGAGLTVYTGKRNVTEKTIATKQQRIDEVGNVVDELIKPKMQRLTKERADVIESQRLTREVEKGQCKLAAVQAYSCKVAAVQGREQRNMLKAKEQDMKTTDEERKVRQTEIAERIKELEEGDEKQSTPLNRLESDAKELQMKVVKIHSEIETNRALMDEENGSIAEQREEIKAKEQELQVSTKSRNTIQEEIVAAEKEKERLEGEEQRAQQTLAVIITGVGGKDNAEFGWKNQCNAAQQELNDVERQLNIARGTLENLQKATKNVSQNRDRLAKKHQEVLGGIKTLEDEIAALKAQGELLPVVDNDELNAARHQQRQLAGSEAILIQRINGAQANMRNLELQYQEPRGFDKTRFYGAAAKLFRVKDPDRFLPSIDAATMGMKFSFVVEDSATSKLLLNHGRINRRVTFLPLDSLRPANPLSQREMQQISTKVGNKAWAAMDLVEYDPKFRVVVQTLLGSKVICEDLNTAHQIAFDANLRKFCVTLDGDTVRPEGIVEGGATVSKDNLVLGHVHRCRMFEQELSETRARLAEAVARINELQARETRLQQLNAAVVETTTQLNMKIYECEQNRELRDFRDAERMIKDAETKETEIRELDEKQTELKTKIIDLKTKMSAGNAAEVEKREAEQACNQCRDAVRKQDDIVNRIKHREMNCKTTADDVRMVIETTQKEIADREARVRTFLTTIKKKEHDLVPAEEASAVATAMFNQLRASIAEKSTALQNANTERRALEKEIHKAETESANIRKQMETNKAHLKGIEHRLNTELFQEYSWLADEYEKLGTAESNYQVEGLDEHELKAELDSLKAKKTAVQRSVGTDNNMDFDQIQRQYDELMKRHDLCKQDKDRLVKIIEHLDEKKQELIELAVAEVNRHFGRIFSTLLPGANCKLQREVDDRKRPLEALRIRVAFSKNLWKESLSELSGGQRSLVALSLILAMLKMNPAPIYVLDEIDAALDLSHTQNVGRMIRKHFKQSQFVVVSLKEGMFNNANVVYRISFGDGVSKVTRKVREVDNDRFDEDSDEE